MTLEEKEAVEFILHWGPIDGAHHKQWVLDQVLRILLKPDDSYDDVIAEQNSDPEYDPWDVGIAP